MGRRSNKQIRENLKKLQNGQCYWCKVKVTPILVLKKKDKVPDTMETLDHLYHRTNKCRKVFNGRKRTYILACFKCNQKRAKFQQYTSKLVLPNGELYDDRTIVVSFDGFHESS